jgi:hypothetical protein
VTDIRPSSTRFPPLAYLIGAQKAGTTTLAALLGQHPELALSDPKEPDFFTGNWERGWDWYAARFAHAPLKRVLLDASTSYSMAPLTERVPSQLDKVPERIAACRPDARFIYVVRDPVERAWSAYWHAVRVGAEHQIFEQAVGPDSVYLRASRYSFQITRYHRLFPTNAFLYIDFRDLRHDLCGVLGRCLAFLGLPASAAIRLDHVHHNRSFVFHGPGRVVAAVPGGHRMLKGLHRCFGRSVPEVIRRGLRSALTRDVPRMNDAQRRLLQALLEEEYGALRKVTGITL